LLHTRSSYYQMFDWHLALCFFLIFTARNIGKQFIVILVVVLFYPRNQNYTRLLDTYNA